MASQSMRPARTLMIFAAVVAVAFLIIGLNDAWKPQLGLDLQGGRIVRLSVSAQQGDATLSRDSMSLAREIIDERANGNGVSGAIVTTDGSTGIDVAIPGKSKTSDSIVQRISAPSQLRFRLVVCSTDSAASMTACPAATAAAATGSGITAPRAPFAEPTPAATTAAATPTAAPATSGAATPIATAAPAPAAPKDHVTLAEAQAFMANPPAALQQQLATYNCAAKLPVNDLALQGLVTCDQNGIAFLLTPTIIEGTEISDASYGLTQNSAHYQVNLSLKNGDAGSGMFGDVTQYISGTGGRFAITVDGQIVSAPTASERIGGGSAQITGTFTLDEAKSLSNNLKFGQLPVKFDVGKAQVIGPELAGNQLTAGLWAGAIGLLLVMLFSLLYYRGLGTVVIGSLVLAGIATYALVALLSKGMGVSLDLPGIAGLIVAVGITADSFIVYFERIRDEMRDGKSMRVAVDSAWLRARRTCLAADTVSLLAAGTLYVFASNEVKGFAFMLGLSTLVDLLVFFYFTHPLVKLLSLRRFFNRGHRLSGLDAKTLGVDAITVGGKA